MLVLQRYMLKYLGVKCAMMAIIYLEMIQPKMKNVCGEKGEKTSVTD